MLKRFCDRCGKEIFQDTEYAAKDLLTIDGLGNKKKYDLCDECSVMFLNFMNEVLNPHTKIDPVTKRTMFVAREDDYLR